MMSNDNIKIQLEDTISIDNDQLTFDLGDDVTYDVASVTGSGSGATYGDGRFDPSWYGTNDPGTGYTVNIGNEAIVTESADASVVIVTLEPATNVNVSLVPSATTLL